MRRKKIRIAAAIQRHVNDLLRGNGLADFRVGHLDRYDAVIHFYRLLALFDLHCRIDVQRRVHVDLDSDLLVRLNSGSADLKLIVSNRNDWKRILSLIVRDCSLSGSVARARESDGGAREGGTAGISNNSCDPAADVGPCGVEQNKQCNRDQSERGQDSGSICLPLL